MIQSLQKIWNRLISIGIDPDTKKEEERYIRFTNLEAMLTVFGVVFYVIYSIYAGYYVIGAVQGLDAILIFFVLLLNHKQQHKKARMLFLVILNSVVLVDACFIGNHSGINDFFYISYTIPFLLFSVRDYKYILAGVLLATSGFTIYPHLFPYFTAYNLDVATQINISQINTWVIFILFGMAIYILAYFNFMTETKLAESNKKLEEQALELRRSNEDLEQFAYIISHDLKAPVRNISSFMQLLSKQFGDSASKGSKEIIDLSKQSADRLSKQIDDMLSYCLIDRNLPPTAPVDLNEMIQTIRIELNEKIKQNNAAIIVEQHLPVLDDIHSSMMHHVFQNLIANAIKFNTNEKPEVRIGHSEKGGLRTFSVSDNGIGISPMHKSKLFQMFQRLHTSEQFEGTGIGLAVCKKIINFYRGEIWFESEVGQGTTFFFSLQKPTGEPIPEQSAPMPLVLQAA